MTIRIFQKTDLPRLQEIAIEAFPDVSIDRKMEQKFGIVNGIDWTLRKIESIANDVQRDPRGTFVVEENNTILGFITTWHHSKHGIGYIPNLAIATEHHGKGLGRKLIEHALAYFRELGLSIGKIETLSNNETGNYLYRSIGFEEVAQQAHLFVDLKER